MQQFVTIFVLCGESGRKLFEESDSRLTKVGLDWDRDKSLANGQLAYWINFLDAWSMGDSFDRFLSPENELKRVDAGSHQLVCCRRENVRIKSEPRNEEEARLRQILTQAREAYQGATSESYLFQIRSVFSASDGFNPEAQQDAP
jgi:hypothetical protein